MCRELSSEMFSQLAEAENAQIKPLEAAALLRRTLSEGVSVAEALRLGHCHVYVKDVDGLPDLAKFTQDELISNYLIVFEEQRKSLDGEIDTVLETPVNVDLPPEPQLTVMAALDKLRDVWAEVQNLMSKAFPPKDPEEASVSAVSGEQESKERVTEPTKEKDKKEKAEVTLTLVAQLRTAFQRAHVCLRVSSEVLKYAPEVQGEG